MSLHEPERVVDRDPTVMQGEDEVPREPPPLLDPYTPGPKSGSAAAAALWVALAVVALLAITILVAAMR